MQPKEKSKNVDFYIKAPPGSDVFVAGTFNDWDAGRNRLDELPSIGAYGGTVQVPSGTHQYSFIVDGCWQHDPQNPRTAPNGYWGVNSVLTVE
jgi:1,4-alpha-glucan branching enzyme